MSDLSPSESWYRAHPEEAGIERGGMQWFEDHTEYPKMLFKREDGSMFDITVTDEDQEAVARQEGFAPLLSSATENRISEKDAEIATLKAQLAAMAEKRGPGRPPKTVE